MQQIKKLCVIGAGTMGAGIAAQAANAGIQVVLLDLVSDDLARPNAIAIQAIEKLTTTTPPALTHPTRKRYIQAGNLRDDLPLIKECDLVIEAIIEKLVIKQDLYQKILPFLKDTAILASNTSTLRLSQLTQGLPSKVCERFVITHFFNPPRYMELLELVVKKQPTTSDLGQQKQTQETQQAQQTQLLIQNLEEFIQRLLGKTIIRCNDMPGFIANRVGCFLLEMVVRSALEAALDPAKIDQIFTKLLGFPKTGIFGLYDLIGHDVMQLISASLIASLPAEDAYHEIYHPSRYLDDLRKNNLLGRKSGGGFYRVKNDAGERVNQVINPSVWPGPASFSNKLAKDALYKDVEEYSLPTDIKGLLWPKEESQYVESKYSEFFVKILHKFFAYAKTLVPGVTERNQDIDLAMQLGYGLKHGPFALQNLCAKAYQNLCAGAYDKSANNSATDGPPSTFPTVFGQPFHVVDIAPPIVENATFIQVLLNNDSASLYDDCGDLVFVSKSKMNALNFAVFELLNDAVSYAEDHNKPLYIYSTDPRIFSAGADLKFFKECIEAGDFDKIEKLIRLGQQTMLRIKYSPVTIVACPVGVALGGGCELLLHAKVVVAHQNISAGLVELGIGVIPAFGGTKEMFLRANGDPQRLLKNLQNILLQHKVNSADYLFTDYDIGYGGQAAIINYNKGLILREALAVGDESGRTSNGPEQKITIPEINLTKELNLSQYDELQLDIVEFFQQIISRKTIRENELLELEVEKFMELIAAPESVNRLKRFIR